MSSPATRPPSRDKYPRPNDYEPVPAPLEKVYWAVLDRLRSRTFSSAFRAVDLQEWARVGTARPELFTLYSCVQFLNKAVQLNAVFVSMKYTRDIRYRLTEYRAMEDH